MPHYDESPDGQRTEQPRREPPKDNGKRLATLCRRGNRAKPDEELRVSLDTYEGHPFLSLRVARWRARKFCVGFELSERRRGAGARNSHESRAFGACVRFAAHPAPERNGFAIWRRGSRDAAEMGWRDGCNGVLA